MAAFGEASLERSAVFGFTSGAAEALDIFGGGGISDSSLKKLSRAVSDSTTGGSGLRLTGRRFSGGLISGFFPTGGGGGIFGVLSGGGDCGKGAFGLIILGAGGKGGFSMGR